MKSRDLYGSFHLDPASITSQNPYHLCRRRSSHQRKIALFYQPKHRSDTIPILHHRRVQPRLFAGRPRYLQSRWFLLPFVNTDCFLHLSRSKQLLLRNYFRRGHQNLHNQTFQQRPPLLIRYHLVW